MWFQQTFFSALRRECQVNSNVRRVVAVFRTASAGRSELGSVIAAGVLCCDTVTIRRSADCSHTMLQLTPWSATPGVTTCLFYIHTQTEYRASGFNRTECSSAAGGVGSGLTLLNCVWEVLGSKMLTGSPAIPMSLSSFNDLLHLKVGHDIFHPRLNQFTIHWHPRFWLYDSISQVRRKFRDFRLPPRCKIDFPSSGKLRNLRRLFGTTSCCHLQGSSSQFILLGLLDTWILEW